MKETSLWTRINHATIESWKCKREKPNFFMKPQYLLISNSTQRRTTSNGSIPFLALGSSQRWNQLCQGTLKEPEQPWKTNNVLQDGIKKYINHQIIKPNNHVNLFYRFFFGNHCPLKCLNCIWHIKSKSQLLNVHEVNRLVGKW